MQFGKAFFFFIGAFFGLRRLDDATTHSLVIDFTIKLQGFSARLHDLLVLVTFTDGLKR